jgi:hypothetical protein
MAKRASTNPAARLKMQCHMYMNRVRHGWHYTLSTLEGHPDHPSTKKYNTFMELQQEAPYEGWE